MRHTVIRSSSGFSLVEAVVAVGLCMTAAVGVAQLIGVATRAVRTARERTSTTILAAAKMDELRSLAWTYELSSGDNPAIARSDFETDVSQPDQPLGGVGLSASPAGTLAANIDGYVDYCDEQGRWVGRGALPPRNAVFVRRWAVWPLPADPDRTLVLHVLVTTIHEDRARASRTIPSGSDALLWSVRTRKGS
jgi:hypothetical protein